MDQSVQLALSIGMPTLAILLGILINNSRLSGLRAQFDKRFDNIEKNMENLRFHFDQRIDDMRDTWRAELHRVEEVLDARLKHLEEDR